MAIDVVEPGKMMPFRLISRPRMCAPVDAFAPHNGVSTVAFPKCIPGGRKVDDKRCVWRLVCPISRLKLVVSVSIVQIPSRLGAPGRTKEARKEASYASLYRRPAANRDCDIVLDARQGVPQTPAWVGEVAIPEVDEELDPDDADDGDDPSERENEDNGHLPPKGHAQVPHHCYRHEQDGNVGKDCDGRCAE